MLRGDPFLTQLMTDAHRTIAPSPPGRNKRLNETLVRHQALGRQLRHHRTGDLVGAALFLQLCPELRTAVLAAGQHA
jgi:hypothetical protein